MFLELVVIVVEKCVVFFSDKGKGKEYLREEKVYLGV